MNSNDIYKKSALGREEINNQSLSVLPREARTLLIMIDGKKTYQSYIDALNKSAMFAEFGGIAPLFELLLEFQCIEISETTAIKQNLTTPMAATQTSLGAINEPQSDTSLSTLSSQTPEVLQLSLQAQPPSNLNDEVDFAIQFDSNGNVRRDNSSPSKKGFFGHQAHEMSYDTIKSDLATYIEKNAPSQDAWGYLLSLEQCENAAQLLELVQRIQKSTSGDNLANGMDKYRKSLKK